MQASRPLEMHSANIALYDLLFPAYFAMFVTQNACERIIISM